MGQELLIKQDKIEIADPIKEIKFENLDELIVVTALQFFMELLQGGMNSHCAASHATRPI